MSAKGDALNLLTMAAANPTTGQMLSQATGTAISNGVIPDVGSTFNETTLNNIHATYTAQINALRAVLVGAGLML